MEMNAPEKSAHQYGNYEMSSGEDESFYDKKKTNADDRRDMLRMNKPQEMRVRNDVHQFRLPLDPY